MLLQGLKFKDFVLNGTCLTSQSDVCLFGICLFGNNNKTIAKNVASNRTSRHQRIIFGKIQDLSLL